MKYAHTVAIAFAALSGVLATAVAPKPKEQILSCNRGPDGHSMCVHWAEDGACDSSHWQSYMRQHCQTSCAFCSDGRTDASLAVKVKNRKYGPSTPWHKQEVKTTQTKKVEDNVAHKTHKTQKVEEKAKEVAKTKCKDANHGAVVFKCAEGFRIKDANDAYCAEAACNYFDANHCCEKVTLENAQTQREYYDALVGIKKMPNATLQHKTVKNLRVQQHNTVKNLRVQQHKLVKTPATQKHKNCKMLPDSPNAGCTWRMGCDVSVDFMKKHCATFCGFCTEAEEHKAEEHKVVTTTAPKKMVTTTAPKKPSLQGSKRP